MTDTVVGPSGTKVWEVSTLPDYKTVGHIHQQDRQFSIEPVGGSVLDGIKPGPYLSKENAMDAIGTHTKGECRLLNPR